MTEFETKRDALIRTAYPRWDEARARAVRFGANTRFRRRQKTRKALTVATAVALTGAAMLVWTSNTPAPVQSDRATETRLSQRFVAFADGSQAELLNERADVALRPRAGRPLVELASGRVRFTVQPHSEGSFQVISQSIQIEVMAARFIVEALPEGTHVTVEQGQANVKWNAGAMTLHAGSQGTFPPPLMPDSPSTNVQPAETPPPHESLTPPHSHHREWRRLAKGGRYEAAFQEMRSLGTKAVRDEPADLLLAADVARLSGHPQEAVAPLERLLAQHARDARAPSAAFTLGKLLVERLNAPERGALRFAQVQQLAPQGPLAQAALAREAEALWQAGRRARASELVERYAKLHPHGPHLEGLRALTVTP